MGAPSPDTCKRVAIVYATTSGSTRLVSNAMAGALAERTLGVWNIADAPTEAQLADASLVILGTPTYGIGDCHSNWREFGPALIERVSPETRVALFCLADSRVHGQSFAGGLIHLKRMVLERGLPLIGSVSSLNYHFCQSPSLEGERFPGLVLEYRRNRSKAMADAVQWTLSLFESESGARFSGANEPSSGSVWYFAMDEAAHH